MNRCLSCGANWDNDVARYSYLADALASTQLPGNFHKDPADRILIAIARRYDAELITCDQKILDYPHVKTLW
jgi:PIN domain nuclease of toxin-antitoxin system